MPVRFAILSFRGGLICCCAAISCAYNSGKSVDPAKLSQGSPNQNVPAGQEVTEQSSAGQPAATPLRAVKKAGWEIPGLQNSKSVQPRTNVAHEGEPPSKMFVSAFEPTRETTVEVERYVLGNHNTLYIFPNKWLVEGIKQYDVNGRSFCYVVTAVMVETDKTNHVTSKYAAKTSLFYYDEDGDKRFELFEHGWGRSDKSEIPATPEWAPSS